MNNSWSDQVEFMQAMPPAAAKILLLLFISDRSLTGRELQFACGMAERTIQGGLDWLQFKGLAQNNGKFNGWSLTSRAYQLPLPFAQLNAGHQNALPASHGAALASNRPGESFGGDENGGENRKKNGFLSSSSSLKEKEEEEEEEENGENRKIYGFRGDELREMLRDAGVGDRSRKMRELLALDLDIDWVNEHIHVWRRSNEPVGYLITRLLSGDTPPPCNCQECQAAQYRYQIAAYDGLIER